MTTEDTVFAKIIRREIPAHVVYEEDETLAFLDINPNNKGHTLVIPKKRIRNIFDADDATLAAVMRTIRKITPAIRDAVHADGVNIHSNHEAAAGQEVFHLHFHIIPRFITDGYTHTWGHKTYKEGEAALLAKEITAKLA